MLEKNAIGETESLAVYGLHSMERFGGRNAHETLCGRSEIKLYFGGSNYQMSCEKASFYRLDVTTLCNLM